MILHNQQKTFLKTCEEFKPEANIFTLVTAVIKKYNFLALHSSALILSLN
jgi:hypothetical protein